MKRFWFFTFCLLFILSSCGSRPSRANPKIAPAASPNQPTEAPTSPPAQTEAPTPVPTPREVDLGSQLEMVSLNPAGRPVNGNSYEVAISENGLYVAFTSYASDLVPVKTKSDYMDVFVYNRLDKKVVMVSVSTDGKVGNSDSMRPSISADGRLVVFSSGATNLVPNDTNGKYDVFIHDRDSDGNGVFDEPGGTKTELVSVSKDGGAANGDSMGGHLKGSGRFVTFFSFATNLVPGDTNKCEVAGQEELKDTPGSCTDVFVRDMQTGKTILASVSSSGEQENEAPNTCELGPDISADGRFVVFSSAASNLVPGKTNNTCHDANITPFNPQGPCMDVFLHDNQTGETTRLSESASGEQGNADSARPVISSNGRYVAFESDATNLDPSGLGGEVYEFDTQTKEIKVGSVNSQGQPVRGFNPVISDDGRFVGFVSQADIVTGENSGERSDFYIHDFQTGMTYLVSEGTGGPDVSAGLLGNETQNISGDAKWAAFISAEQLIGIELPATCTDPVEGELDFINKCNAIYLRDLSGMFK